MDRRELHAASVNRFAPGPGVGLIGQTLVFVDRVGQGEDDWPRVEPRHRLDDFPREQFAHRADADDDGWLEVLDGRDDLRALARQVEMIERFARWEFVR